MKRIAAIILLAILTMIAWEAIPQFWIKAYAILTGQGEAWRIFRATVGL